jgi:hypothetical protein
VSAEFCVAAAHPEYRKRRLPSVLRNLSRPTIATTFLWRMSATLLQAEHSIEGWTMLAAMPWLDGRAELALAIGRPRRYRIAWYFDAVYSAEVRQLAATSFAPALCRLATWDILNPLGASLFRSSTEPE